MFARFMICVLLLLPRLANQQMLFNSSEQSVSAVNDSLPWLTNATATATPTQKVETPQISLVCNERFSCRNRCNNESTEWDELSSDPECHCDIACMDYHDCCADFLQFCQPVSPVDNPGDEKADYTCFELSTELASQNHGVFVISTCAEGWIDEDVRTKCLAGSKSRNRAFTSANILEDIPVSFISFQYPGTSYRNIYCGLCNNVGYFLLPFWTLTFRCNIQPPSDYNTTQVLDFLLKYCPSRIVKPDKVFNIRTCVPVISTCLVSNQTEIEERCLNATSGLIYSKQTKEIFKNYHCLLCNGLSVSDALCGPRLKQDHIFNPKSFEIVLEFSSADESIKPIKVTPTCASGEVYDPHLEICEPGSYILHPSSAIRDKYRVKLWMYPLDDQITSVSPNEFRNSLCDRFSLDPSQIDEISVGTEDLSIAVAFNLYAGVVSLFHGKMTLEENLNVTALLGFKNSFEIDITGKRWVVLRVTQRQLSCVQSEEFFPGEFTPPSNPTSFAFVNKTGQWLPPNRYFLFKDSNTGKHSLLVCKSKFTVLCPFNLLLVSSSAYKLFPNHSLQHIPTGQLYAIGEYDVKDNTALICTNNAKLNITATATPTQKVETPQISLVCNERLSCRNRCKNQSTEWDELSSDPACHCDIACMDYHDCCADFLQFCEPVSPVYNPGDKKADYTCCALSTELGGRNHGVFVISTCAEGWIDEDVRAKCLAGSKSRNRAFTSTNILEDIPVSFLSPLYPGTSYRNIYCGLCNNVSYFLLPFWTLTFRCNIQPPSDYNTTQVLDFLLKYCPSRVVKPDKVFNIRTCVPVISTCLVSNQTEIEERCLNATSGLIYSKQTKEIFKNYHCLLCNGLSVSDALCGPRLKQDIFNPKSFEIVLEFSSADESIKPIKVTPTCASGEVYDPHLEICEPGSYILHPSSAIRDKYRVKLWMYPLDDQITSVSPNEFRNSLCDRFSLDPSQIDEISVGTEDLSIAVAFNLYAGVVSLFHGKMTLEENLNVTALLGFNNSFEIDITGKRWVVLRVTQRQLSCAQSEEFFPGEFTPPSNPTSFAFVNKTGQWLPPNRYFLFKDSNTGKDSLLVCKSKFTVVCPFNLLSISSSEYKLFPNHSLQHIPTGQLYAIGEYDVKDNTALICTNSTKLNITNSSLLLPNPNIDEVKESGSLFLWYFTLVGFSVSILTLMLTVAVHFIFNELRTPLPGKNLISLCMALFLAQFIWLFGSGDTDKPIFCRVVAAVLHYLFLVTFTCTAVIAFDTRRTFSSQISRAPGRSVREGRLRFLTYTCVAWGIPMLFVGTCFLLDNFQVVEIGYGNDEACWLVKGNAKIVAFGTPVACVLLYNVAAFSHTMWAINTARKQTTGLKSNRRDRGGVVKVYVRLVTLMGFTWFFAFTAELVHKSMIYPFVVLTSLQGVYIFLAFVCKTRILNLINDTFQRSKKDSSAATQNIASTGGKGLQQNQSRSETEETHM